MATLGQPSGDQRPNPDEAPVTTAPPGDEIDMAFLLRDVPTSPPNTTGLPLGPMASLAARARGESANQRLHARWAGFDHRRKHPWSPTPPSRVSLPFVLVVGRPRRLTRHKCPVDNPRMSASVWE